MDSNKAKINNITQDIFESIQKKLKQNHKNCLEDLKGEKKKEYIKAIEEAIEDITEYGRAVHGEMAALMQSCRGGLSTQNTTLFVTTFSCHNCAKHVTAAGIKKVVYIESYPKSMWGELYESQYQAIEVVPFHGISSRRYFDYFSMNLTRGDELVRRNDEYCANYENKGNPRLGAFSYRVRIREYILMSCEIDILKEIYPKEASALEAIRDVNKKVKELVGFAHPYDSE